MTFPRQGRGFADRVRAAFVRVIAAALGVLAVTASAAAPAPPAGPKGPFCLAFNDEFDDAPGMSGPTRGLAADKWNSGWYKLGIDATSQPVQASEAQWYGPGGIVFNRNGMAVLKLTRNPSAEYGKQYRSGAINTASRFTFSASRHRTVVEARVQVPGPVSRGGGYWPAFWLLSNDNSPGGSGTYPPEIDIFEFFGDSRDPYSHLHTTGGDINKPFRITDGATDLSRAFHIYTIEISAGVIRFFLDGRLKWLERDRAIIARLLNADPMYVLLNMQFGGAAGVPTGAVPASMRIDHVRVWQARPAKADGRC